MKNSSEIKKTALGALSGNWGGAIGCSAAALGISYVVSFLLAFISNFALLLSGMRTAFMAASGYGSAFDSFESLDLDLEALTRMLGGAGLVVFVTSMGVYLICSVAASIVLSNIHIGQYKFHMNLVSGKRASVTDIFHTLKGNFWKTFLLYLVMQLKAALWMLLFYLPGVILFGIGVTMSAVGASPLGASLIALGLILMLASLIPYIMAVMRYAMAPMVYLDNPSSGVLNAIKGSKALMKGYKGELFVLYLSFAGWYLLSLFTCGIGALVLNPYIICSECVFYNERMGRPTAQGGFIAPNGGFGMNGQPYNPQNTSCNPGDFNGQNLGGGYGNGGNGSFSGNNFGNAYNPNPVQNSAVSGENATPVQNTAAGVETQTVSTQTVQNMAFESTESGVTEQSTSDTSGMGEQSYGTEGDGTDKGSGAGGI